MGEPKIMPLFAWAQIDHTLNAAAKSRRQAAAAPTSQFVFRDDQRCSVDTQQGELDLTNGLASFVPKNRYQILSYRLTEYLVRKCGVGFMRFGFHLERQGIVFLGDLVQEPDFFVERLIGSGKVVRLIRQALQDIGLDFNMKASRWNRPADRFSHRHWVHRQQSQPMTMHLVS